MMASTERDCEPESKEEGVNVWITIADDNVTSDNTSADNDELSDLEEGEIRSPIQHGGTLCDNTRTGVQQRDDSSPDIASAYRRSESSHRTDDTVFLFGPDQINHDSAAEHRHIRDDQSVSDNSDIEPRTENGGRPTNKVVHDFSGKHDNIHESEVSNHSSSKSDDRPRNKHNNKSSGKPDDIQESKHNKHGPSKLHNYKSSKRNDVSSKSDHRQTGDDSLDNSRNSDKRQARKDVYDSACEPAHYKTSNDRDKRTCSDNTSSRKSLRHSSKSSRKSPRHSSKASNSRSSKRNHTRTDSPNSDRRIIVDSNCMNKYRDRESHSMLSSYSRTSSETSASIDKRHLSEDRYIPSRTGQHSSFDHNEGLSQLQRQYKYDFHSTHTSRHGRKSRSNRPYHSPPRTSSYKEENNRGSGPYRKLHSSRIERRRETPPDGHSSGARWESRPRHTRYPTPHRVDNKKHKLYETQDSSFVTSDLRHLIERQKQDAPCENLLGIKRNLSEDDTDEERDRRFSRNKRMRTHDDDSTARPNKGVNDDTRSQDHYISERRKRRHDERSHSREVDVRNRSPDRNDRRQLNDSRESACSRPDPLPEQYDMVDQRVTPLDDRSPRSSGDYGRYSDGCGATYPRSLHGRDSSHADMHDRDIADNDNQSTDYRESSVHGDDLYRVVTTDDTAPLPASHHDQCIDTRNSSHSDTVQVDASPTADKPTAAVQEFPQHHNTDIETSDRFDDRLQNPQSNQYVPIYGGSTLKPGSSVPRVTSASNEIYQHPTTAGHGSMLCQPPSRLSIITSTVMLRDLQWREPRDIIMSLAQQDPDLGGISRCSVDHKDIMVLFLGVFARALDCKSMKEHLVHILSVLNEHSFFDAASSYFMKILPNKAHQYWKEMRDMLKIMTHLAIYSLIPVMQISGIHDILQIVINKIEDNDVDIDDEVMIAFKEFSNQKDKLLAKHMRLEDQSREATQHQLERFEDSQRDFRDVGIFPNVMDMQVRWCSGKNKSDQSRKMEDYLNKSCLAPLITARSSYPVKEELVLTWFGSALHRYK